MGQGLVREPGIPSYSFEESSKLTNILKLFKVFKKPEFYPDANQSGRKTNTLVSQQDMLMASVMQFKQKSKSTVPTHHNNFNQSPGK